MRINSRTEFISNVKLHIICFTVFYIVFFIYRSEGDAERDISSLGAMG